jgi:hypothetical protein
MKNILFALFFISLIAASCQKNKCTSVTITQTGTPCSIWGIKKDGITYLVDSLGDVFKHEGLVVCAKYELYEDLRLCVCCGGTRAKIISMSHLPD